MSKQVKRPLSHSKRPPASGRQPSHRLTEGWVDTITDELVAYHRLFHPLFHRREQHQWSVFYLCGQLSSLERKTIEPMVLALQCADPNAVRALQHFIAQGTWDTQPILVQHQQLVAESLGEPQGVVIADGSGFPKQGQHSAGVAHQYCGHLGKVANCQEGVFLVYASEQGATFLDTRLYVPAGWFEDDSRERWQQCGIPDTTEFHTEPELALEMLGGLVQRDTVPFRWVTCDEHFGQNPLFLDGICALGKWYLAEVPADTRVWLRTPRVQPPGRGLRGRPRSRPRLAASAPRPHRVDELAARLPASAWKRFTIQEGSKGPLVAQFAFVRVTTVREGLPGPRVWLVVRRRLGAPSELKFYLSNAPTTCARSELARRTGWRWPIETTLKEGKGEVGMDHYETRSWWGWHHHMTQTFLAHHFLVRLRLQLKKSPGADDAAGALVSVQSDRKRRHRLDRHDCDDRLPSASQPCCLLLPSQTGTERSLPSVSDSQAQNLVVI